MEKEARTVTTIRQEIANECVAIGDNFYSIRENENSTKKSGEKISACYSKIDELRKELAILEGVNVSPSEPK